MNKKNLFLIFVVVSALALRVAGLKLGLPSETGGLTTLHPDESVTFHCLEGMNPSKLDFYPGTWVVSWGTFQLYTVGALIKTLDLAGVIKLGDRKTLKENLGEVDKMYLSARALSALFGVLSVVALYFIGCLFLSGRAAIFSAMLMAVSQAPVMASYLVKPDSIMLFWGLMSVYFSFKLLRKPSTANYFLAGFFLGLAFVTKYSAALLAFFPLTAHFYHAYKARNPFLGSKKFFISIFSGLAVFFLVNPYFILRFSDEFKVMSTMASYSSVGGRIGCGLRELYATYFLSVLPAAFGWSLVPFALAAVARWFSGPVYEKRIIAVYCVLFIAWAGVITHAFVLYTLLVAPFIFLAAGDLAHSIFDRRWGKVIVIAVFAQGLFYTLFVKRNYISDYTIKEADSWIRQNLPEGSTVAIPKNDTWTPFVIRRHAGSFKILEGASSQTMPAQAVAELGKIYSKADYVVISEPEYALIEAAPEKYPAEYAALKKVFSGTREVKRFEKRFPFYILPFNYGNTNQQVNFMNPDIRVLKVIPLPALGPEVPGKAGGRAGGGTIKR